MDKLRCNTLKVTDWQRYCNIAPWTGWLEPHWIVCSLSQKSTDPALGYKTINTRIVLKLFPCNYGHRTPVRDDVSLLLWVSRWYTRRGIAVPSNSLSPAAPQAHKALSRVARVARLSMLQALYPGTFWIEEVLFRSVPRCPVHLGRTPSSPVSKN